VTESEYACVQLAADPPTLLGRSQLQFEKKACTYSKIIASVQDFDIKSLSLRPSQKTSLHAYFLTT
jgi:hypothetical protein